ncbi:MAG: hypothetical protein FP825_16130 [Hyphomonas sp.]|uniref:hypothetical protein n=1 Tax=Hyphomonas sp. TaxID=87 RepID=UPI0017D52FDA|nr:hypothetical protein [Hyphomonas sp.]MBA3069999.1 hypothetical protein [Hyphomonas sp.]MBU3919478.1 hypothetical protein [Alphaproteobacteria bacterium]MBU4060425.1 hypothetical protein [Alphaproteobacteria bacterium]MBU4163093.1 hypothetical protein [Alphaproteobacteria bacterium]
MLYFLDCEFNGFGGELISLALSGEVSELYLVRPESELNGLVAHAWVENHVLPFLSLPDARPRILPRDQFGRALQDFFAGDAAPSVIADWPEDLVHLMQCLILSPGQMVRIPDLTLRLMNTSAYPTERTDAVQHNALWDARALRHAVVG